MIQYPSSTALTCGPSAYPGSVPDAAVGAFLPCGALCGPAVLVGQGPWPLFRLLGSFDPASTPTPTWVDLSSRLRSIETNRGRNSETEDFDAGTLTAILDNRDSFLVPGVNAAPMNRVWVGAECGGEVHHVFVGYAESWQSQWDDSGNADQTMTVAASDEFKPLARAGYTTGAIPTGTLRAQLDQILGSDPAPRRYLLSDPAGANYPGWTPTSGAVLDVLRAHTLMQVPQPPGAPALPASFVSRKGEVVAAIGDYRSLEAYNIPAIRFSDSSAPGTMPYAGLTTDFSDSMLVNMTAVTFTDGAVTFADAASVALYGTRETDYSVSRKTDPAWPNARLTLLKAPLFRVLSLGPSMADPATALRVLRLDLLQPIAIHKSRPAGGSIDQTVYTQSIALSAHPGEPPSITLGVSPI